jgi:hypothetical protein
MRVPMLHVRSNLLRVIGYVRYLMTAAMSSLLQPIAAASAL